MLSCSAGQLSQQAPPEPSALRLATYNIHFLDLNLGSRLNWGPLNWENRKDSLNNMIDSLDADLIAFQEMEPVDGNELSKRNDQKKNGYRAEALDIPLRPVASHQISQIRNRSFIAHNG